MPDPTRQASQPRFYSLLTCWPKVKFWIQLRVSWFLNPTQVFKNLVQEPGSRTSCTCFMHLFQEPGSKVKHLEDGAENVDPPICIRICIRICICICIRICIRLKFWYQLKLIMFCLPLPNQKNETQWLLLPWPFVPEPHVKVSLRIALPRQGFILSIQIFLNIEFLCHLFFRFFVVFFLSFFIGFIGFIGFICLMRFICFVGHAHPAHTTDTTIFEFLFFMLK